MNWKLLLAKYVAHVAAAEGPDFAISENLAPCGMLNFEFTHDEKLMLGEVFDAVRKWEKTLTPTQREPLPIDQLFTPNARARAAPHGTGATGLS